MTARRILIVRVGALGDVLHALPAVAALRQGLLEATIDWVVDRRWQPLLVDEKGVGPVVSRVHIANTRLWSAHPLSVATTRSVAQLWRTLRKEPYDVVVDMQGTLRSAVIGRMARSPALTGFADPRESAAASMYTRRLPRRGRHVVDQGTALLSQALDLPLIPTPSPLPQSNAANAWAEQVLGQGGQSRMALLAPTAGWGAKEWPVARFAELAKALVGAGWRVLVNAPEAGSLPSTEVVRASEGVATAVPCSVVQLIALARQADLVVGGDSGPVHLAAALGRPVVGLYGPTDPARNSPWGPGPMEVLRDASSQTSYKHSPEPDPGLARISVAEVVAAIERVTQT